MIRYLKIKVPDSLYIGQVLDMGHLVTYVSSPCLNHCRTFDIVLCLRFIRDFFCSYSIGIVKVHRLSLDLHNPTVSKRKVTGLIRWVLRKEKMGMEFLFYYLGVVRTISLLLH